MEEQFTWDYIVHMKTHVFQLFIVSHAELQGWMKAKELYQSQKGYIPWEIHDRQCLIVVTKYSLKETREKQWHPGIYQTSGCMYHFINGQSAIFSHI